MGLKHRWSYESVVDAFRATEKSEIRIPISGKLHVALVFPGPYPIGISNLGFQTVHRLLCCIPDVAVERFFFPVKSGFRHAPPFYSFETKRPLGDFDIFAFSFSYEGDFDRLPHILGPLEIPIPSDRRNRFHPLLIAGGAAIGSNPDALSRVCDILIPGEAETALPALMKALSSSRIDPEACAELPGVWVPRFSSRPHAAEVFHNVANDPAYAHIVSSENVFGGAHLLEIMRGCPRSCAFCLARSLYHPPRAVPVENLQKWLDLRPSVRSLGLVAPSLFDHPQLPAIFELLEERNIKIRNSSVKWERLTDDVLQKLSRLGPQGLTLAPETGSRHLGQIMRKTLPEKDFCDTISRILAFGFTHLKLYFMVGLPEETPEDLEASVWLITRVLEIAQGRLKSLSVTFSGFVPKRGTPWESKNVLGLQEFKQCFALLWSRLQIISGPLKVRFESPNEILRQARLSKIGVELAEEYEKEAQEWKKRGTFIQKTDVNWDF